MTHLVIFLSLWSVLSTPAETFSSKQAALDYLNNSNIWIAGMPGFELDSRKGDLKVSMTSKQGVAVQVIELSSVMAELQTGDEIKVVVTCANEKQCVVLTQGATTLSTNQTTFVMRSSFGDDDYTEEYLEKGGKVVDAINYLNRFYKD